MLHVWSRVELLTAASGSCNSQRMWINQNISRCSVWKGSLLGLGPSRHLFAHTSHDIQNILNDYTALKTPSQASVRRQESLTPQPSCQLICVNNYSKKKCHWSLWYQTVWTPCSVQTREMKMGQIGPGQHHSLFTTDDTIRSGQLVFP